MAASVQVQYIGWEDDFRYAEEKARITEHIKKLASESGFSHAYVLDMIMRYRYRSQGPWIDVHLKRQEWVKNGLDKHILVRLWFNEDGDLCQEPEYFGKEGSKTTRT